MSTRVNVWFNAFESKKLRKQCENCGLSPYAYIKELTMRELFKNGEKRRRLEKGNNQDSENGIGTVEPKDRVIEKAAPFL